MIFQVDPNWLYEYSVGIGVSDANWVSSQCATFHFASNTHGIHTILTIYSEAWISRQFDHLPAPKASNKYILSDNSKILCYVIAWSLLIIIRCIIQNYVEKKHFSKRLNWLFPTCQVRVSRHLSPLLLFLLLLLLQLLNRELETAVGTSRPDAR